MSPAAKRVDVLLVKRGLFESRARARAAIEAGLVTADDKQVRKPSELLPADAAEHRKVVAVGRVVDVQVRPAGILRRLHQAFRVHMRVVVHHLRMRWWRGYENECERRYDHCGTGCGHCCLLLLVAAGPQPRLR